jgi:5' nucleotidase, deoxy (Pyrimidine), cytosolic type C protein (NT5C)
MIKKRVLAFDFDDVVADFVGAFYPWHNHMFGTDVQFDQVHSFNMSLVLGVDPQTLKERVSLFVRLHHHLIEPVPGLLRAIPALSKYYDHQIVTSRCESIDYITAGWLEDNRLAKYFSALHFTNGSYTIYPERTRTKAEVCESIRAVALIEDADHNAIEVAQTNRTVYRPHKPWNGKMYHPSIKSVQGWDEIKRRLIMQAWQYGHK